MCSQFYPECDCSRKQYKNTGRQTLEDAFLFAKQYCILPTLCCRLWEELAPPDLPKNPTPAHRGRRYGIPNRESESRKRCSRKCRAENQKPSVQHIKAWHLDKQGFKRVFANEFHLSTLPQDAPFMKLVERFLQPVKPRTTFCTVDWQVIRGFPNGSFRLLIMCQKKLIRKGLCG